MDVSIIIVTYNTLKLTSECIDSIVEKTDGISYEIILVDNMSSDCSKDFFENDKRIKKYIYNKKNYGFGVANNIGMQNASGKYFFLLNSDTLLINNAVKSFYDYAESHSNKAIYGCYLVDGEGNYNLSYFDFPAFTILEFIKSRFFKKSETIDYSIRKVQAITGADLFIPRSIIKQCGGFDANIFLYGEESELQFRMKKEGIDRVVLPMPKIIHLGKQSMTPSLLKQVNSMGSSFVVQKLHMKPLTYKLSRLYYAVNYTIRSLVPFLLGREGHKQRLKTAFMPIKLKDSNIYIL